MQQGAAIKRNTCNEMGGAQAALAESCKLQQILFVICIYLPLLVNKDFQNANEGCNSCASLAGLLACFIAVAIAFSCKF